MEDGAFAQITPDSTLGSENSTVTSTGAVDQINGGATRGANLFHSFQEFNIEEGRAAYFTNPTGIENILSRVTGANPSNIMGTLGVAGGNANLFLINPNGIIFGQNARLDVRGSFVATTANAIGLSNGDFFSTNSGEPLPNQLLNVNPNAFFFNQIAVQAIINRSTVTNRGLAVPQGRSLLLVGGDVRLEGGQLSALGGRVELGGLASPGSIGLNDSQGSLSFPDGMERADVYLTNLGSNSARVNVAPSNSGSIAITARNVDIAGGSLLSGGLGIGVGFPGTEAVGGISLNATGGINITNSLIFNGGGIGPVVKGGDVNITTESLSLSNGARLATITLGQGNAGNIQVNASDSVFVSGGSVLQTQTIGQGDAGDINIIAGDISFDGVTSGAYSSVELPQIVGDRKGVISISRGDPSLLPMVQYCFPVLLDKEMPEIYICRLMTRSRSPIASSLALWES